jgi:adenosylcobyric acid synthase
MVQGTASSVGKSTLVAGLCRLFARRGVRVAPFKAQNMSNNAAVCAGGGEIGRAQYAQALAAGIEACVDMNPILLKPQADACQVIVLGKLDSTLDAQAYYRRVTADLWPTVADALDRLRSTYDLVVAEGAGSPAEINLRDRDLVNMRVAEYASARVLLVADIDKGGAFAALLGTWQWLEAGERALVRGFVLNKFRGDARLLAPAPRLLEERTGVPVVGVVPYLEGLRLAEEDAASLSTDAVDAESTSIVEIGVARLPHLANFDEFGMLAAEPGVRLRFVSRPEELRAPDLVIVPGTKATIPDLMWLQATGLSERIRWLAEHATPVLGICGGFQMLGNALRDPLRIESEQVEAHGLALLPVETELASDKQLARVGGRFQPDLPGVWRTLGGVSAEGYEIHMGRTLCTSPEYPELLSLKTHDDGLVRTDGVVAGTYVHGLFEAPAARAALLSGLASARGLSWQPQDSAEPEDFDVIADAIEAHVALDCLGLNL